MTLAHHDAAKSHQGRRGKAKLFSTQQSGHYHIAPGFQSAIGLQDDPRAQVIEHESLMGFRNPQLPGQSGMLDAGQG